MAYLLYAGIKDLFIVNEKIWCRTSISGVWKYSNGEIRDLTVMIMAGIHPEEEGGVLCLERMMQDSQWLATYKNISVIAVPCRNLFGFQIKQCFENSVFTDRKLFFENEYCKIYTYREEYLIVLKTAMATKTDRKHFWSLLKNSLKEAKINGFVHLISFRQSTELRANTYYFSEERLIDMNDIGQYPQVPYICNVQKLVQLYQPDMVIDLHEGKGKETYLYVDSENKCAVAGGEHIVTCLKKMGIPIRTNANDRVKIDDGIYSLRQLNSGKRWIELVNPGKILVLEAGIENEIKKRINILRVGIEQSIAYEWGRINGKTCNNTFDKNM